MSSSNSASSGKKDSLKQVFGEAANLFDKFKNKKATTSSTDNQTNSSSSIPQSSSFSSLLASAVDGQTSSSSLLQNLAISFHKTILNNQNANASSGTSVNATNSSQEQSGKNSSSLVIIDDESFDDDEASFEHQNLTAKVANNFKTSQSEFNIKNVTILNQEQTDFDSANNAANNHTCKLTSSTSLYKVATSTVEDFLQDEPANISEEKNLLRNRFQTRINSNEQSEKNKVDLKKIQNPNTIIITILLKNMSMDPIVSFSKYLFFNHEPSRYKKHTEHRFTINVYFLFFTSNSTVRLTLFYHKTGAVRS